MQINKKLYTTITIAILTISMVLMAFPLAHAIAAPTLDVATGPVGTDVTVSGTSTTTGGLIELYLDSVRAWDGEAGFLDDDYAIGTSYEFDIEIPEATAGPHSIIVRDVSASETSSASFTVESEIALSLDLALPGDAILVDGTGFDGGADITMEYFDTTDAWAVLETSPLAVETTDVGSFTCSFDLPDDAQSLADNIRATDGVNTAYASLEITEYIEIDPESGQVGDTVAVTGRGFTPDESVDIRWMIGLDYITVGNDVATDSGGDVDTTITVPSLPDPIAPGTDYTIRVIDNDDPGIAAEATFTLVEDASIELSVTTVEQGDDVTVSGTWFTDDEDVTITLDGEEVATDTTDGVGSFSVIFEVPTDLDDGTYTVTATDDSDITASASLTVTAPIFECTTRASTYMGNDIISIYTSATHPADMYLVIVDPAGLEFYTTSITSGDWEEIASDVYMVPYDWSYVYMPLPADAPLGSWNFTAYEDSTMDDILDTNLFTVVEKPTQQDVLDALDTMGMTIQGLFTSNTGQISALINTKSGQIMTSLDAISAKLQSIEDVSVIIATDVGELKVDLANLDMSALTSLGVDITAIKGDVATIRTNIGTVNTAVSNLDAKVSSVSGDLATVQTNLGTLDGKITSVDGKVATVQTSVGTIQADVSGVSGDLPVDMTPVWIAVVLSLVAAIAAIFAVITIRQKIAG